MATLPRSLSPFRRFMHTIYRTTAPLWLALCLVAQDGAKVAAQSAVEPEYDKFVAEFDAAQSAYSKAMKEVQASDEYKQASAAATKERATMTELRKQKLTD